MTTSNDLRQIVARFTKVAEDMMNTANDQASSTISPDEAQQALGVVVDELRAIIDAIPGEGGEQEVQDNSESSQPTDENSQKMSQLEETVKDLTDKLTIKEREEIAEDYADLHDPAQHDAKVQEVLQSKDSNAVWAVKIDAIDEFQNSKPDKSYKPVQTASYTKIAQNNGLMYL